ncbi:hypothetical protein RHODGE_RHODGE_01029 [Rhodoplanes serenus]|uniref:DUF2513 domain-containing protein n=1 Tax=Rhodoplanes serenus TaxID=200615 RepID=A0A3S4F6A9_9BRAD|nr:DUF2513 domain-containing protein [Rhodoplanes serenus]VCU06578.1 hypothetical protein RHODPL_RHODPL_00026 [Rhodoplanes serenus]VCU07879.1 hypothetical protein RHODGE_RHODGE_01029 [Rhodoplanes serenus]
MTDSASVRVAETGDVYTISLDTLRGIKVRRDMEMVRKVMLAIEAKTDLTPREIKIDGEDDLVVGHHIELLFAAGMIDGLESRVIGRPYAFILVRDLTWEGHDFVASLKNDTVWNQLKTKLSAAELASLPLSVIKSVATAAVEHWAKTRLGL